MMMMMVTMTMTTMNMVKTMAVMVDDVMDG